MRVKQNARKSTCGKAPRKQLATRARDAVIESQNDESPRNDLDDPFFEFVEERARTPHTARKSTWGRAPRKQLATRARAAAIESDDDGSSGSEEEEADSGIVQTGRTNQTARKSTGGAMPRRQLAFKARRSVIPSNLDQTFDSDFDNEPPIKQQKLEEAKATPKPKPFNFTEGEIVVIDEKTDEETRVKYLGGTKKDPNRRLIDFIKQKWSKVEDGYCIVRSTAKYPVVKIKLEYVLGINLPKKAQNTINQQIKADKEPAALEPACEEPASDEPDQVEFEVLEFLGPEIYVPEEKVDNNEDQANIEPKKSPEMTKETNTASEENKSERPDVIIID